MWSNYLKENDCDYINVVFYSSKPKMLPPPISSFTWATRLFNPFLSTSHDALAFANCWVSSWEPCRSCRSSPLRSCSAILRSARVLLTALVYRRIQEKPPVITCRGRRVHSHSNIKRGKSKVWRKLAALSAESAAWEEGCENRKASPTLIVGLDGCSSEVTLLSAWWAGLVRFSSSNNR